MQEPQDNDALHKELSDLKAEVAKTRKQISILIILSLIIILLGMFVRLVSTPVEETPIQRSNRQIKSLVCSFADKDKPLPPECQL